MTISTVTSIAKVFNRLLVPKSKEMCDVLRMSSDKGNQLPSGFAPWRDKERVQALLMIGLFLKESKRLHREQMGSRGLFNISLSCMLPAANAPNPHLVVSVISCEENTPNVSKPAWKLIHSTDCLTLTVRECL